ncbi:hypothetical protein [Streptomyces sp. bgisy034]|uniref:hypothetical protein n=1 Tax=Streptomyces sp. bgisy034 TaxID=3413774 RepID=UPI003EB92F10
MRGHPEPDRQRTLALLQHPDRAERLDAGPDLIAPAVEELLRLDALVSDASCVTPRA